jgi:UDP-GlcNAc:undecaprenyl-phosphate/decaprenyl-phosphate GlcNAc-1-phosphate transferase
MPHIVLPGLYLLAILFGGLISVLTLALLHWLSLRPFAVDREGKHGISQKDSSRLGGIAILVSVLLFSLGAPWLSDSVALLIEHENSQLKFEGYEWLAVCIGLVGLLDDFDVPIKPSIRIVVLSGLAVAGFVWSPSMLPDLGKMPIFSDIPNLVSVTIVLSVVVLVGFTNAANMVDGANGLLGIISAVFFLFAYFLTNDPLYWALVLAISTFVIFNVATGKIFMGDFGAYSLGAVIVLLAFQIFNQFDCSIWLFASFLSYPCVEIIRIMLFRVLEGHSPIYSDNNHLHNYLHQYLLFKCPSALLANSLTGFSLAIFSSFLPFLLFLYNPLNLVSSQWLYLFLFQTFGFVVLAYFLADKKREI